MDLTVDVCIATYRRPDLLRDLLESLSRQKVVKGTTFRVLVVDNDAAQSAHGVVQDFASKVEIPVIYECEPFAGISSARNRCLALTEADWVCFVDDDETVVEDWLDNLLKTAAAWNAEVVFGPVLPRLPSGAPKWIVRANPFSRRRFPTGTQLKMGETGNVLVARALLDRAGRGFDLAYNLTGGGDTEFFFHLSSLGTKMVYCNEAIATETVLPNRMSLRWLLRRYFRGGQGYARLLVPRMARWQRAFWFAQRIANIIFAVFGMIILLPAGLHWSIKSLLKLASNCGQLSALSGRWIEEYRRT